MGTDYISSRYENRQDLKPSNRRDHLEREPSTLLNPGETDQKSVSPHTPNPAPSQPNAGTFSNSQPKVLKEPSIHHVHKPATPQPLNLASSRWNTEKGLRNSTYTDPQVKKPSATMAATLTASPSIDRFGAAWEALLRKPDGDTEKTVPKISPVSGVPPHLWHLFQDQDLPQQDHAAAKFESSKKTKASSQEDQNSAQDRQQLTLPSQSNTPPATTISEKEYVPIQPSDSASQKGRNPEDGNIIYENPNDTLHYPVTKDLDGGRRLPYPHELPLGFRPEASNRTMPNRKPQQAQRPAQPALTDNKTSRPAPGEAPTEADQRPSREWRDPSWGTPELSASDRRRMRIPKPTKHSSVSDRSCLSASLIISDDGLEKPSSSPKEPDIRNEIAPKHNIHDYGGKWMTHTWGDEKELKGRDVCESFAQAFVSAWMNDVPTNVKADFLRLGVDGHWRHDVDTFTGHLVPVVDFPETLQNPEPLGDEDVKFRQLNMSAAVIMREDQKRLARRRGERKNFTGPLRLAQAPGYTRQPRPRTPSLPPGHPKLSCYMRPALEVDMEEVLSVYNLEIVQPGGRAMDVEEQTEKAFVSLLKDCQQKKMPFIVIIQGSPGPDSSAGASLSRVYPQYPQHRLPTPPSPKGKILGFGLITSFATGIAGSHATIAGHMGRLTVVIHPGFRQKRLGTICTDKLLSCVHPTFVSDAVYTFVNPANDPVYERASPGSADGLRMLVAEVPVRRSLVAGHTDEAELDQREWLEGFLIKKFGFSKLFLLESVGHTLPSGRGMEYEMSLVMYAVNCRPVEQPKLTERV